MPAVCTRSGTEAAKARPDRANCCDAGTCVATVMSRVRRRITCGWGVVGIAVLAAGLVGCGGGAKRTTSRHAKAASPAARSATDRWGTKWLCRPGLADDPCRADLSATAVLPSGKLVVTHPAPAKSPSVDCFYVYPTISGEPTINSSLAVGLRQQEVAIAQASRFSQVCNVYAPVYRQITLSALAHPRKITLRHALIAYGSVLAAFRDYLAHYNHGRGIVFVGHSQGATILIRLLQRQVDNVPDVRHRLVSALLMGGNVTVPKGKTVGGDFAHIPACTRTTETGCVVAYSSFTSKPRPNSQFGRTSSDAGVGLLAARHLSPRIQIMCVNPASPAGGTAWLQPYIPTLALRFIGQSMPVKTPWVSFPREFTGRCETSGNATWLQVSRPAAKTDGRPALIRLQQPILGLHILDINIALGNLVQLATDEAAAYTHR
jgi:Protein of unknown function (DUF3089)